jgi:hypothetical protein
MRKRESLAIENFYGFVMGYLRRRIGGDSIKALADVPGTAPGTSVRVILARRPPELALWVNGNVDLITEGGRSV